MSRTIRPFIADAIAAYLKPLPTMPSVQVIGFEDMPVADSEDTQRRVQLVCKLSDKELWIYAIFTVDAIEHFEDSGCSTCLTGICGGVIILKEYSVAHSNPLAIVVDEFAFVGSEGCLAFGDPIYCMQNETVARLAATYCSVARVIPDSEQEDSAALVTELVDIMSHISPPPQTEENVADLDAYSPYPGGVYRSSIISSRQKQMLKAASAWFPQTTGAGEHAPVSLQSSPAQSIAPYKISSTSPILTKSLSKTPQDIQVISPTIVSPKEKSHQREHAIPEYLPIKPKPPRKLVAKSRAGSLKARPPATAKKKGTLPSRNKWSKNDLISWIGIYWMQKR